MQRLSLVGFRIYTSLVSAALLSCLLVAPATGELLPLNERLRGPTLQAGQLTVDRHGSARGLAPGALVFLRALVVPGGEVLRFGQEHDGLPVLRAEAKVLALGGKLVALTSRLAASAELALLALETRPRLSREEAIARLLAVRPDFQVRGGQLAIATGAQGGAREVWVLDVVSVRPFLLMNQQVDARSGELLGGWPTMVRAQGRVYSTNPVTGSLVIRELQGLSSSSFLEGSYAEVYRCWLAESQAGSGCTREARPDARGDYLFMPQEPDLQDPFAEVQAYYHVDRMSRWLSSSFGFSRAGPQRIFTVVNFQVQQGGVWSGYPNAAYGDLNGDGQGDLLFGEGPRDFAYDADVIYHELGHLVVDEQAGLTVDFDQLGFNTMALSINEGYADLFSCLLTGDATVGEYAIQEAEYLRSLEGQASCPGSLTGESHEDSMIWSQAIWSVRGQTSQQEALDRVLYTTLAGLTPLADFQEAAALIVQVAQQQQPALAGLLADEFSRRGYDACSRLVPLVQDQQRSGAVFGALLMPQLGEAPGTLQYRIDVPAGATRLEVELAVPWPWPGIIGAYVRRGAPVGFSPTNITADLRVAAGTRSFVLQLGQGQAPLVPGSSYYLLLFNEADTDSFFTVSYTTDAPPPPDQGPDSLGALDLGDGTRRDLGGWQPDVEAGGTAGGKLSGGCSLGLPPGSSAPGWLLLVLGALLRRRR